MDGFLSDRQRARTSWEASLVNEMLTQIEGFMRRWLPALATDQRAYVTVAIGCTGGQHRSVYMAEHLGAHFADTERVIVRHREQPKNPAA